MNRIKEFIRNTDPYLAAVFVCGLLLRVIYLAEYSQSVNFDIACGADVREYFDRSMEILSGSFFPEKPDIHGIFYPLAASPVLAWSKSVVLLRTVQTLLNFGAFWALFHLLGLYRTDEKIRRIFITLAMFYTVPLFHTAEIISESILIPLAAGMFYALYRARKQEDTAQFYSAAAGTAGALIILTHAGAGTFPFLVFIDFLRRRMFKRAACFIVPLLLVTGAVSGVKSLYYGRFVPVQANGGFNFYLGNSAKSDGTCRLRPGLEWRRFHLNAEKEAAEKGVSTDRLFLQKTLEYTLSHPLSALSKYFIKAAKFFSPVELISGADPAELIYRTLTVKSGLFTALFLWLSAAAGMVVAAWKKREKFPLDFALLLLAVFATNVLTVTSGRYRVMAYPSLFLFAACSIACIPYKVTAVFAVISVTFGIFADVSTPSGTAEMHRILGEAAYRKADFDTARRHLEAVRAGNSDPSGVENMLGGIYEKQGDLPQAAKCYMQAVKLEPERFEGYMNLAQITPDAAVAERLYNKAFECSSNAGILYVSMAKFLLKNRKPDQACKMAAAGRELLPGDPDAWNTWAVSCACTGNLHGALQGFEKAASLDKNNANYRRNAEAVRARLKK